jgi:hypothetical protein
LGKYQAERDGRFFHREAAVLGGNDLMQEYRSAALYHQSAVLVICAPRLKKALASH